MGQVTYIDFNNQDNSQIYDLLLDGERYTIRLDYSPRPDAYYLSLYSESGEPLCLSQRLVYGVECFPRVESAEGLALPSGFFTLYDARAMPDDPIKADLGTRARLVYDSQTTEDAVNGEIGSVFDDAFGYVLGVTQA